MNTDQRKDRLRHTRKRFLNIFIASVLSVFILYILALVTRGGDPSPGPPGPFLKFDLALVLLAVFAGFSLTSVVTFVGFVSTTIILFRLTRRELRVAGPKTRRLAGLYSALAAGFSESELRDLCFHLEIDHESLPGDTKTDKARELVIYLMRRNRINELVKAGKELRPDVPWDELVDQS